MAGFANDATGQEVVYANNVDFTGNTNVVGQFTANAQLMIGSTASPHIQMGTITSPLGTVTIGYSSPNITIDVAAGTGVVETLTGNSGGAIAPVAGNINTVGTGSITVVGSGNTLTTELTGLTNHSLLVGAGTTTITKVGPSATTGQILQSQGSTTDPAFSTATYPSTTTINQILYSSSANVVGGITAGNNGVLISSATGVPSFLADGTTNQVLVATTGAPPSWGSIASTGAITTITGDSGGAESPSAGNFTFSGGTTGLTFAGTAATETLTGTLVLANGGTSASLTASNGGIFYSTASAGAILAGTATARQMLQSGASSAPAWSTATWPATTTINQLLYSSAANTVGGITAGNNGVLISSSSGVPSWLADGTTGQVLTATTGSPPSWANAAASSITITGDSGGGLTGNSFTFTGGSTGLTFSGSGSTETLTGTLVVANGGTGRASQTAYMPIVGGTTTTAAQQSVATGTQGYVLSYQGASSIPTWVNTYPGITSGSAPASGFIGEQVRSYVAQASAVTLTPSGSSVNVTSISLTAGIWDVSCVCAVVQTVAGSGSTAGCSIVTVSGTGGTDGDNSVGGPAPVMNVYAVYPTIPSYRLTLSATTTVYMTGNMSFSTGTWKGYGRLSATRVG